jgi:hypothetical protein
MNRADEGDLAWALADSATTFLNRVDHARLCTQIGAGEQDSAIRDLLTFYANTYAELPHQLAAPIRAWIDGYAGTDNEPAFRRIYERINVSATISIGQQPPVDLHHPPGRLIAKRSQRSARIRTATRPPAPAVKRVGTCGIATGIEDLLRAAIEARRVAQTTTEAAVREARSAHWSWDRISTALGGNLDTETLRRTFGLGEPI